MQESPELWVDRRDLTDVKDSDAQQYIVTLKKSELKNGHRKITVRRGLSFCILEEKRYTYSILYEDERWSIKKSDCYPYIVEDVYEYVSESDQSKQRLDESRAKLKDSLDKLLEVTEELRTTGDIVNFARQFIGNPYVWGGTDLVRGADCSGFVQSVYAAYGIALPRTADEQAHAGLSVDQWEVQPGDLLFFWDRKRGKIGHVGIYAGGGTMVEAKGAKYGIVESVVNWDKVYCIERVK